MLVVGRHAKKDDGAWAKLAPFLANAEELTVPKRVSAPKPKKADLSALTRTKAADRRHAAHRVATTASWSVTSVTAEARHVLKMTRVAELPAADDPTRVVVQDTLAHRADAGVAWGSLIHGLLEHAMRHGATTRQDLRRLAMWLTVEEPKLRVIIDEAIETVEAVRASEFWKRAQAGEHSVETPFMINESRQLVAGVIDLLHSTPNGWMITDYKTDIDATDEKVAGYSAQLERYKKALSTIGVRVAGAELNPVRRTTS
jgi:ATP-dependent exoDNAse (exonuclease V) beta subunit